MRAAKIGHLRLKLSVVALWLLGSQQAVAVGAVAGQNWSLCPTPASGVAAPSAVIPGDTPIQFSSDTAHRDRTGASVLTGKVHMTQGPRSMDAMEVRYNQTEGVLQALGKVRLEEPDIKMQTQNLEIDQASGEIEADQVQYQLLSRHGRGAASHVTRHGSGIIDLNEARYTTCEPGQEFWVLSSGQLKLDKDSGVGTAKDVVLKVGSVPLLYTPYMTFPLDDRRKSGFLAPSFGTSDESGLNIAAPYYVNLAQDKDLVVTPRILSRRGLQLAGEGRYLGENHEGEIGLEYLHDEAYGADRTAYLLKHRQGWLSNRLVADVDLNHVSDKDYLDDLSDSLSISSTTHLQRRGDLTYTGKQWTLLGRVEAFQTLDDSILARDRPAERLPQLVADGHFDKQALGLGYTVHSEWTTFSRDVGSEGNRYDLALGVNRPFEGAGYFVRPKIELQHTGYDLHNTDAGAEDSPTRTLPLASLDSGLVFERLGEKWTQTLEPRLYYLYIPYEKQDKLPVFDTGEYDFNYDQLFREDRFNGVDRIGDTHQVTGAVTSRLVDSATGQEKGSVSVGQIVYFKDRRVQLPGVTRKNSNRSDVVGDLSYKFTDALSVRGTVLWNPQDENAERSVGQLRYRSADNKVLNISFRRRRDIDIRQADVAFGWPLSPAIRMVGRLDYDLTAGQDLESFAGLEYESCCYKITVIGRRYVHGDERNNANNSILAQLTFKGLTSLGSSVDELLKDAFYDEQDDELAH